MKLQMTEEEIVKKYKGNPCDKHIQILAELNGVKAFQIKRILAKHGLMPEPEAPKKRGPKGKTNESEKETSAEQTLNDIKEIESSKVPSASGKIELHGKVITPIPAYLIPEEIKKLCEYRLEEINVEILSLCNEIDKRSAEREAIKKFLRGEFRDEPKNGIHGPLQP